MWLIFFTALILFALCSVIYISHFSRKLTGNKKLFCHGMTAVLVLTGIADLLMNFGEFKGAFAAIGFCSAIEFILYAYLTERKSPVTAFFGKAVLVAALLELVFFQFPSYRLLIGDYEHTVLNISQGELENCTFENGGIPVGKDEISISYHGLDKKIGTVWVNAEFPENETGQINFFVDMTEETGYYYRLKAVDSAIVSNSGQSQFAMVQLAGKSTDARFRFSAFGENHSCVIKEIELNKPIPFDVMPLRMAVISLFAAFIYACIKSAVMNGEYEKNQKFCHYAANAVTLIGVCVVVMFVCSQIPNGDFFGRFKLTEGNQITEELVLAFEHGQFSLLEKPSDALLAMDNPYDHGSRFYGEIDCLWDHALYEGKYYSYYGIAPLLLFIPYHLITGYFFPEDIAVMIFSSLGLLFLSMTYSFIVKKWFGKISVGVYLSGLVMLLAGCGIWCCAGRPMFYEMAVSAGFMCLAAAVYLIFTSGIICGGKTNLPRIFLSSLLMGLSVMCRPTLAVYAVCGFVFFIINAKKQGKGGMLKYICCAFLPVCCLGAFQMYYNYARFDSVFEFGIKYSLTINDFTHTEFHLHNMLVGVYNFLLAPPAFIPDYPFVSAPFSFIGLNGYYFKDEGTISGLIFLVPPIFGYLSGRKALKLIPDRKNRILSALAVGTMGIIMPLVIVCAAWESGYSARYMADFSWQAIMGAYAVLFLQYIKSENAEKKRVFTAAMGICAVYTLIVVSIESFVFAFPMISFPEFADMLNRFAAFYK